MTCLIVSHDSGFLDHVCTHIIDYNNRKLRVFKGNLSKFVEQKPEAKAYYELTASTLVFKLPEPGDWGGAASERGRGGGGAPWFGLACALRALRPLRCRHDSSPTTVA